jgi:hypothetical protein
VIARRMTQPDLIDGPRLDVRVLRGGMFQGEGAGLAGAQGASVEKPSQRGCWARMLVEMYHSM